MTALICGSFAYDTIMVFQDHFKNHILPVKVHILNVAFHVPELRREFGGCAANIAYNLLKSLGNGLPVGPILIGLDKPAHVLTPSVTARGIVNMSAIAVVDAEDRALIANR